MKLSGIGGQAVIEGIMMRNKNKYSVAIRKPDNEIEVVTHACKTPKNKITKLPVIRGIVNFVDSLVLGISTLTYSSSFYEDPKEQQPTKVDTMAKAIFKERLDSIIMAVTILVSVALAVALFMVAPYFISRLLISFIGSQWVLNLIEGIVRVAIFIFYLVLISLMKDIKRTFMYHGAEHKCINCIEHGMALTVENVRNSSREHKRCGTSFLLVVMFISVIFFIFIRLSNPFLQILVRILLVPIIAGISYEVIRWAGKSDSKAVVIVSKPGMWLQHLTTREPDDDMIEVGIKAVEAVFDWRSFLDEYYEDVPDEDIPEEAYYYLEDEDPSLYEEYDSEEDEQNQDDQNQDVSENVDDVENEEDEEDLDFDSDYETDDDLDYVDDDFEQDEDSHYDKDVDETHESEDLDDEENYEDDYASDDDLDYVDNISDEAEIQMDEALDEKDLEPEILDANEEVDEEIGLDVPIFKQHATDVAKPKKRKW